MKFLIVTLAPTLQKNNMYYSYAPYVYEMNLWAKNVTELGIVSPVSYDKELLLSKFDKQPQVFPINSFSFISLKEFFRSLYRLPGILYAIYKAMKWADHIHLRCPGNIGLLGCLVQILFPNTPKSVKYAGNWDPKSKQPFSYKVQQFLLRNTWFTKNVKVLVYGDWKENSKNIKPFFTASYSEKEKEIVEAKHFDSCINFVFVGTLSPGKQPLISVKVVHELLKKGINVNLDMYGDGSERELLEHYILEHQLQDFVVLHGNKAKEIIKEAYKRAHFLVFISKSEGWPKVVAEAMFWKCLPISTAVSCVPTMLDQGKRGSLVSPDVVTITKEIEYYLNNDKVYADKVLAAFNWSRTYTLDKFENEIKKLLIEN